MVFSLLFFACGRSSPVMPWHVLHDAFQTSQPVEWMCHALHIQPGRWVAFIRPQQMLQAGPLEQLQVLQEPSSFHSPFAPYNSYNSGAIWGNCPPKWDPRGDCAKVLFQTRCAVAGLPSMQQGPIEWEVSQTRFNRMDTRPHARSVRAVPGFTAIA